MKVKKQDISIIDDFQTNDVQFVFSREKPNESKNEDLSMAVFGIKADIMFHKIMALKNFRNSLAHGNGPLDDSQETEFSKNADREMTQMSGNPSQIMANPP